MFRHLFTTCCLSGFSVARQLSSPYVWNNCGVFLPLPGLAANAGYDPTPTGSKPVVLPLHQSAVCAGIKHSHTPYTDSYRPLMSRSALRLRCLRTFSASPWLSGPYVQIYLWAFRSRLTARLFAPHLCCFHALRSV